MLHFKTEINLWLAYVSWSTWNVTMSTVPSVNPCHPNPLHNYSWMNVPGLSLNRLTQHPIIDNWSCWEWQDDGLTTTYNHYVVPLYIIVFQKGSCFICVQNKIGRKQTYYLVWIRYCCPELIEVACIRNFKYQHVTLVLWLPLRHCM
jgi:hypothetical protein